MAADPAALSPLPIDAAFLAALSLVLSVVCVKDIAERRIPDLANLAIALLGLARLAVLDPARLSGRLFDAALAGALLLALRWVHRRWRGTVGLGLGDVKFLAAATLWTGFAGLTLLVLVASLAALAALALAALGGRRVGRATRIPFGPFLALGLSGVLALDALGLGGALQ